MNRAETDAEITRYNKALRDKGVGRWELPVGFTALGAGIVSLVVEASVDGSQPVLRGIAAAGIISGAGLLGRRGFWEISDMNNNGIGPPQ